MKKKNEKSTFGRIMMALLIIFFYAPIIYMIIFSFNEGKSLTTFTGFSLRWYQHMLESRDMMEALYTTFSVALLATAISTVVGTIAAIGLSKSKKIVREIMEQVNNLPMMNPEIVTAIGFMLLFITFRINKGYTTMLLAHIAFCIPYVMLSVMPKVKSLDPNLADAAMDLGCTPFQALIKVIVPQITPGIISGALIAFTMSVDDFIISYFVTGQGVKNLSIMVYTMSKRVNPSINAISTLVVVIISVALLAINFLPVLATKRQEKGKSATPVFAIPAAGVLVLILYHAYKGKVSLPAICFACGGGGINRVANFLLVAALLHVPASVQYPMVTGGCMIVSTIIAFFTSAKPTKMVRKLPSSRIRRCSTIPSTTMRSCIPVCGKRRS